MGVRIKRSEGKQASKEGRKAVEQPYSTRRKIERGIMGGRIKGRKERNEGS